MVVGNDHCRGAVCECIRKDLARMDGATVDQANGNDPDVQDLVCSVDGGAEKVLLLPIRVVPDMRQQVDPRLLQVVASLLTGRSDGPGAGSLTTSRC